MDIVGLTLRPEENGRYSVIGVAVKDGEPVIEGIEPGDILLRVDDLETTGAIFGHVVDALRGEPGDIRILELERNGERFTIEAEVKRIL
jgi:C-terminal processing protease CtpA/Prc